MPESMNVLNSCLRPRLRVRLPLVLVGKFSVNTLSMSMTSDRCMRLIARAEYCGAFCPKRL
jgi:hypothetical protein